MPRSRVWRRDSNSARGTLPPMRKSARHARGFRGGHHVPSVLVDHQRVCLQGHVVDWPMAAWYGSRSRSPCAWRAAGRPSPFRSAGRKTALSCDNRSRPILCPPAGKSTFQRNGDTRLPTATSCASSLPGFITLAIVRV